MPFLEVGGCRKRSRTPGAPEPETRWIAAAKIDLARDVGNRGAMCNIPGAVAHHWPPASPEQRACGPAGDAVL
jgi:hypothetical protein